MRPRRFVCVCLLGALCAVTQAQEGAQRSNGRLSATRDSVVKIFTTFRAPDFESPWTKAPPAEVSGTGFVIEGDRILTNAHVVEMASQIFVQPPNSADKIRAEVLGISRGIDLAVIQLRKTKDRETFHAKHKPLTLREALPEIGSTVQAVGYPLGGEQLSITEGVVSRIEYTGYYQNNAGLRIQVDAALNPGNSGGPVVMDGQVIGVVFSGMDAAENIGYVIPVEEVRAFLDDIGDGAYDGRPRLWVRNFQTCENPALRDFLGLDDAQTGLVYRGDEDEKRFNQWDLLDSIGEHDIDNAGLVTLDGDLRLSWGYLIPRLATEGSITVGVIREGEPVELTLPVTPKRDSLVPFIGNDYPEYFILGPMVFMPVRAELLYELYTGFLALQGNPSVLRADDLRDFEGEEVVIICSDFLPHPITKGYEVTYRPAVKAVNGVKVKSLEHMVETIRDSEDDYLVIDFYDRAQETFVFERDELIESTEEILEDNSIRRQGSRRFMDLWEE